MGTLKDDDDQDQDQTAENVEVEETEEVAEKVDTRVVEEDSRLNADEEDDDREVESNDEDEGTSRKRKESARERRQRAKAAKAHDKEELQLLRATIAKQDQRLNQTERALIETRVTDLENRAATAQGYVNQWNEVDVKATKAGNVQDAVTARQYRDTASAEANKFATQAAQLKAQLTNPQQQAPQFTNMAVQFLQDKPWYNPKSGDEDSLIVEALDKALSRTMDPNDPRYWSELDRRVKKKLPHKFRQSNNDQDDDAEDEDNDMADDDSKETTRQRQTTQRRKGPPTGGSSRTTSGGKVTEIRLPAQMVEAMKEAGQWDDPKVRARVAKRYMDGVRNNRG